MNPSLIGASFYQQVVELIGRPPFALYLFRGGHGVVGT